MATKSLVVCATCFYPKSIKGTSRASHDYVSCATLDPSYLQNKEISVSRDIAWISHKHNPWRVLLSRWWELSFLWDGTLLQFSATGSDQRQGYFGGS